MTSDRIRIVGLRTRTHIGCTDEERKVGQHLEADVTIALDTRIAGRTDDIKASLDYAVVAERVVAALSAREYKLLEAAAEAAADAAIACGAPKVTIRLRKSGPPMTTSALYSEVEITRP